MFILVSSSSLCQWTAEVYRVTETPSFYFTSNESENIYLELFHDRKENKVTFYINTFGLSDLLGEPATIFMHCIKGSDTTTMESEELLISLEYVVSFDFLNNQYSNAFFSSEKVVVEVISNRRKVKANFNMKGIQEIKKRITNYIDFTDYSWKWDKYQCIFEFGAIMHNYSGMYVDKVNVILIVSTGQQVIYKKQHLLDVDFNTGDIGPIKISLSDPLCSIDDVYEFDKNYTITIKTPEPKTTQLLLDWK
jgi:hypothetical protein